MLKTPEELKKLLEDPATWTRLLDTPETQWIAAMLARFVTVQEDGGVRFPAAIQVNLEVTSVLQGNAHLVQITQPQMLAGIEAMEKEGLLAFSRQTAQISLHIRYRDMITEFIR